MNASFYFTSKITLITKNTLFYIREISNKNYKSFHFDSSSANNNGWTHQSRVPPRERQSLHAGTRNEPTHTHTHWIYNNRPVAAGESGGWAQVVDEFALNDGRGRREHEALSRKPQEQEAKTERRKKKERERERAPTHIDDASELNIRGTTANSRGSRLLFVAPFHRKPSRYARLLTRKSLLCFGGPAGR